MMLLTRFPGLKLEAITIDVECLSLSIASTRPSATCPACESFSGRLDSHYERTVTDLCGLDGR